jgi:epoxyqueuosine reductase
MAFAENSDERVLAMIAWALGKIGGTEAISALRDFSATSTAPVKAEIDEALDTVAAMA